MPFALIAIGLVLIVTSARNTYVQLGRQLQSDFTGERSFIPWLLAIGFIGALGYVDSLKDFSKTFMALIVIAIFISNRGFFQKFSEGLANPIAPYAGAGNNGSNPTRIYDMQGPDISNHSDVQAQKKADAAANAPGGISFWDFLSKINPMGSTPAY